jgi:hypothetical protein
LFVWCFVFDGMTTPTKSGGAFGDLLEAGKETALLAFVAKAMEDQQDAVAWLAHLFDKETLDGPDEQVYNKIVEVLGGEPTFIDVVIAKVAKAYTTNMLAPAASFTEYLRAARFDPAGFLGALDTICGTTGSPFMAFHDGSCCDFDTTLTLTTVTNHESNRYIVRLLKSENFGMLRYLVTHSVTIAVQMAAAKLRADADAESRARATTNAALTPPNTSTRLAPEVELLTGLITSMRSDFQTVMDSMVELRVQVKGEVQSVVSSLGDLQCELKSVQTSMSGLRAIVDDNTKHSEALARVVAEQGATVRQLVAGRRHNPSPERHPKGSPGLFTVSSSLLAGGGSSSASPPRGPITVRKKEDAKNGVAAIAERFQSLSLEGDEHGKDFAHSINAAFCPVEVLVSMGVGSSATAAFDGDDRSMKVPAEILSYLGTEGRSLSFGSFGMKEYIGRETQMSNKRGFPIYQTTFGVKVIRQQYVFGKEKSGEEGTDFESTTFLPSDAIGFLSFVEKERGMARLSQDRFGLDGGLLEVIETALDEFSRLTCVIAADLRTLSGRGHLPDVDIFTNIIMMSLFLNQWQGMWSNSVSKLRFCDPTRLVKDMHSNCRALVASYNGSSPNWTVEPNARLLLGWWCPSCKDPDSPPSVYLCNTKKCRDMVAALQTNVFKNAKTIVAPAARGSGGLGGNGLSTATRLQGGGPG